jgi:hypothetical protein
MGRIALMRLLLSSLQLAMNKAMYIHSWQGVSAMKTITIDQPAFDLLVLLDQARTEDIPEASPVIPVVRVRPIVTATETG